MLNNKKLIPLILAASFISTSTFAQIASTPSAEQKAARAEIDTLTKRIVELSKKLDGNTQVDVMVVERSVTGDGKTVERRVIRTGPEGQGMHRMEGGQNHKEMRSMGPPRVGLGIVMTTNNAGSGVKIAAISPKSPAQAAGLQTGDVITSIDGKAITAKDQAAVDQARSMLGNLKEGQVVKLAYSRAGKNAMSTVKAANIQPNMIVTEDFRGPGPGMAYATRWHGLQMAELNPQLGRYFGTSSGVLVLSQKPEIPQLQPGDVITKIDGKAVVNSRDVLSAMRGKNEGEKIGISILRDRKAQSISINAPKAREFNMPIPPPPPIPPAPPAPPRVAMFIDDNNSSNFFNDLQDDLPGFAEAEETQSMDEISIELESAH